MLYKLPVLQTLISLSLQVLVHGTPISCGSRLQWGLCDETISGSSTAPIDCSTLLVPLDYTNSTSKSTLNLLLARVPATTQPSKGSILLNFGGPGEPDRENLATLAAELLALSGGQYDLITFDTRGTATTLPLSCGDADATTRMLMQLSKSANASDVSPGTQWAAATAFSDACFENSKETGTLIGTAFVARDLMSVVDALGEDGMLRYWGFSYGTTLGATVAAMFPDKIEKMILDGVQNPHQYYHSHADFEEWTYSDKVFSGIFSGCADTPESCPLASGNATAASIEQIAWDLLETVKYQPIVVGSSLLDYSTLKAYFQQALYDAATWQDFTIVLSTLLTANSTELELFESAIQTPPSAFQTELNLFGIHCSDTEPRVSDFDDILPSIERLYNTSRVMGDSVGTQTMVCAQWKLSAKERYQGDFKVKTKNPVLLIGNTFDGHTPIISAYNVSSGFEGSVVLEVGGYGHTSLHLFSQCRLEKVAAYWSNGTLPAPGTVCKVDAPPFSNVTWAGTPP